MLWSDGKASLHTPIQTVEFYLDEELVLVCGSFGLTLVEGADITYISLDGETRTHRIGGVEIVLQEEQTGVPPSGPGSIQLASTIRIKLQPNI